MKRKTKAEFKGVWEKVDYLLRCAHRQDDMLKTVLERGDELRVELTEANLKIERMQQEIDDLRSDMMSHRQYLSTVTDKYDDRLKKVERDHNYKSTSWTHSRIAMLIRTTQHLEQRLNNMVSGQPVPFVPPEPTTPDKEWEGVDGLPE